MFQNQLRGNIVIPTVKIAQKALDAEMSLELERKIHYQYLSFGLMVLARHGET